jgi:hypothetical protein
MQEKRLRQQVQENNNYLSALDQKLGRLVAQLAILGETLAAVVDMLGEKNVQDKMVDLRKQRREAAAAKQAEGVAKMVEAGILVAAELVQPDGFIVVDDVDETGLTTRQQFELAVLEPEKQLKWLGKKAGDEVTVPGRKGKSVIREVYTVNNPKVAEYKLAEAKKAAPAAQ